MIKDRTKQMYADALQKLLVVKSFEKIQVKDICQICGTPRQTFYYHFRDKYDLAAWIFNQDHNAVFSVPHVGYTVETLTQLHHRIEVKHSFYKQVFTDHSQNSIANYIQDLDVRIGCEVVEKWQGEPVTQEQLYQIKLFSYGSIYMAIEWLTRQHTMTAEEFAKIFLKTMPEFLRLAYEEHFK